eukprot:8456097-Karenia_brevis.AAC.1
MLRIHQNYGYTVRKDTAITPTGLRDTSPFGGRRCDSNPETKGSRCQATTPCPRAVVAESVLQR